jgi:hypothetical protein
MLLYTTENDCVGTAQGDKVRIASGAGRYNPVFYAVVGTVALPFTGDLALYVMRLITAALCMTLVWLAGTAIRTWAASRVAHLTLVVACTPMVIYSCSLVSPNGVEIAAALAFWCAAVGLLVAEERHLDRLAFLSTVSGATLCILRPLGPLWCLAAGAVVLVSVSAAQGRYRLLLAKTSFRSAAAVVTISAVASVIWTMSMAVLTGKAEPGPHTSLAHRLGEVLHFLPLWVLQSIAAFPMRNQGTDPAVYVCYLALFVAVMVAAWRITSRRLRLGLAMIALGGLGFAYATTVSSYDSFGLVWQGRYGLPLTVGFLVLVAYAFDRAGTRVSGPWWFSAGMLFVSAQVVSVVSTMQYELRSSPLVDSASWPHPPTWAVGLLGLAGSVLLWWGDDLLDRRTRLAETSRA